MTKFAALLSISAPAFGLAFDGPLPTPHQDLMYTALQGYSPQPTCEARLLPDLVRRQNANSNICGYLNGEANFPLSCPSGPCMHNPSQKWFGCPSSAVITRCIPSASMPTCLADPSCYDDPAAMACTAESAPFCVNLYLEVAGDTFSHWVCGSRATRIEVRASETAGASASAKGTSAGVRAAGAGAGVLGERSRSAADASVIRQGGIRTDGAVGPGLVVASATATVKNAEPTGVKSTGGAARHTAGALVGVVGGVVGAYAVFF